MSQINHFIRVQITPEDIEAWRLDRQSEPLLQALTRATQTPWRLTEINRAVEKVAPYRSLILRSDVLLRCREHHTAGTAGGTAGDPVAPFEFETELTSPFCD